MPETEEEVVVEQNGEEEQVEIVDAKDVPAQPEEEEPEELRGLTKKQIVEKMRLLQQQANGNAQTGQSLKDGLAQLADKLTPQQAAALPVQQSGESDEAFAARFSKRLFEDGTAPFQAVDELIEKRAGKKIMQQIGPAIQLVMQQALKMAENNVRNDPVDGPVFRKYEQEIRAELKKLPAEQQQNPEVFKYLTDQAKIRHWGEAQSATEEQVDVPAEQRKKAAASLFQTESVSSGRAAAPRRVVITEEDRYEAMAMGVPIEEYAKRKDMLKGKR